jgi:Tfp pilus assembly protein PilF
MNLFGFNKNRKSLITLNDRAWVEDNFKWLIDVYGYPTKAREEVLISQTYFPCTFSSNNIRIENLISDLCNLLGIPENKISFELHQDIRDSFGTPYELHGKQFDSDVEITEEHAYKLHLASVLIKYPNRLIYSLIYEFIKIRLTESSLDYATDEDTSLFIYLAGIYFGFGFILGQNLIDSGRSNDGLWETKWSYASEMPVEVMAFSLALNCKLKGEDNPGWKKELSASLKSEFEKAILLLTSEPTSLTDTKEIEASALFHQAGLQYDTGNYEDGIGNLQKVLFLTNDPILKSDAFNNIGYHMLRQGMYEKSIPYFHRALEIDANYGFAKDNLGYVMIKIGKPEEGKEFILQAMQTDNNDDAYSYRNLALYHQSKGEITEAEKNFKLAFEKQAKPVDLLEFHYAEFLLIKGDKEIALSFLNKAVEKGEHEAIARMKELNEK